MGARSGIGRWIPKPDEDCGVDLTARSGSKVWRLRLGETRRPEEASIPLRATATAPTTASEAGAPSPDSPVKADHLSGEHRMNRITQGIGWRFHGAKGEALTGKCAGQVPAAKHLLWQRRGEGCALIAREISDEISLA